ncbi:GNAT family N-acetyltransferase [Jeotgalibaca sp. MA1X17-3]|uniref:GNAT family N-acetyltransferase n=1 Tax=Jeotgalibaca sp. MA1X17-3 TaxID=2908211 RepID=UPI001F41ED2A|nr:GNAT family N-acetyltransferase [Jeotgalibaca sp. MA1X17-3]UJF15680.1 GNAT family N-acetyltransferase [Jeotgalibaca sp. MA1X17-3]
MIREAQKKDSSILYDLLKEILEDMELAIFKELPSEDLKELVVASMEEEEYRYSYRNALVYEEEGKIAGCLFGYKGELEQQLDKPLQKKLVQYGLDPTVSFFPDRETFAGEWYLDSIITHKDYRGKGIAKKLISALPDIVKEKKKRLLV